MLAAKYHSRWIISTFASVGAHAALVAAISLLSSSLSAREKHVTTEASANIDIARIAIEEEPINNAALATPEPKIDAKRADHALADAIETSSQTTLATTQAASETDPTLIDQYLLETIAAIEAKKRYPLEAARRRIEAKVIASFTIGADRAPIEARVSDSAPALLRQATLDAIHEAAPYPKPSDEKILPRHVEFVMEYRAPR